MAIEVKHAGSVRERDLSGLRAFAEEYPMTRSLVVYLGARTEQRGDVSVMPAADFLRRLPTLLQGRQRAPEECVGRKS